MSHYDKLRAVCIDAKRPRLSFRTLQAYRTAVSPDVVLALLDELDDLHYAQSMTGHAHLSGPIKYTQSLRDENRALRAGLEMARACIARGADTTAESVIDDAIAAADKAGGR